MQDDRTLATGGHGEPLLFINGVRAVRKPGVRWVFSAHYPNPYAGWTHSLVQPEPVYELGLRRDDGVRADVPVRRATTLSAPGQPLELHLDVDLGDVTTALRRLQLP